MFRPPPSQSTIPTENDVQNTLADAWYSTYLNLQESLAGILDSSVHALVVDVELLLTLWVEHTY